MRTEGSFFDLAVVACGRHDKGPEYLSWFANKWLNAAAVADDAYCYDVRNERC